MPAPWFTELDSTPNAYAIEISPELVRKLRWEVGTKLVVIDFKGNLIIGKNNTEISDP